MAKDVIQFIQTLKKCVSEYKKQMGDVRDESDAAHFFDPELKKFLIDNKESLNVLATMNFERPFMQWLTRFLYVKTK